MRGGGRTNRENLLPQEYQDLYMNFLNKDKNKIIKIKILKRERFLINILLAKKETRTLKCKKLINSRIPTSVLLLKRKEKK